MTELESLALLIADLNAQVRRLQSENAKLDALLQSPVSPGEDAPELGRQGPQSGQGRLA